MKTRVICYGLGPIGTQIAKIISRRGDMEIVGAIDIDPGKRGKDLSVLLEEGQSRGVAVTAELERLLDRELADLVILATGSSLKQIAGQLAQIISAGLPVISTCEELAYPLAHNPELAGELDQLAKRHGVCVYGTGVNPGFAMDALPLMLTGPCAEVTSVRVVRMQDAKVRRLPFQQKIGAGLTREEFERRVATGSLRHVGFRESTLMIAESLGWQLHDYQETIEPVMASEDVETPFMTIRAGRVAGVTQVGRGLVDGEDRVRLELIAYVGAPRSHDTVSIHGIPNVTSTIDGGLHGDIATAALTVNSIRRVLTAPAGLMTPNDLAIPHWRMSTGA